MNTANQTHFTPSPWAKLPIKGNCLIESADYQLMLASPELLEALRSMVDEMAIIEEMWPAKEGSQRLAAVSQARAVLAKLEGGR